MTALFILLGVAAALCGIICWLIVLIDAFNSALWKGLVAIFCCQPYLIYYGIVEFQHEKKWQILLGWWLSTTIAAAFFTLGGVAIPGR
jgi:hypothetical protein